MTITTEETGANTQVALITAQDAEKVLLIANQRQTGVNFQLKRVGNNLEYRFINADFHQIGVDMPQDGLMAVEIYGRQVRPYNHEHQTRFLEWLVTAREKQKVGEIYGHPDCLFEKL